MQFNQTEHSPLAFVLAIAPKKCPVKFCMHVWQCFGKTFPNVLIAMDIIAAFVVVVLLDDP